MNDQKSLDEFIEKLAAPLVDENTVEYVQELEAILSELEKAAWARSWRRLKAARQKIYDLTMADLRDRLKKELQP